MITNQLFRECLAEIPAEVRRELEISYAVAEKIADIMKIKGISKQDFAKKSHNPYCGHGFSLILYFDLSYCQPVIIVSSSKIHLLDRPCAAVFI